MNRARSISAIAIAALAAGCTTPPLGLSDDGGGAFVMPGVDAGASMLACANAPGRGGHASIITTIPLASPRGAGIDRVLDRAYVVIGDPHGGGSALAVIDLAKASVVDTVSIAPTPATNIAVDDTAHRAYVAYGVCNPGCGGGIAVVELATHKIVARYTVPFYDAGPLWVDPPSSRLFLAGGSVLDTRTGQIITSLRSSYISAISGPAVAVNGAAHLVYRAGYTADTVEILDATTLQPVRTVQVHGLAIAVNFDPASNAIYAAVNLGPGAIGEVDVIPDGSNVATARISVGANPNYVDVDPCKRLVYVSNYANDVLSVIDARTNALVQTVPIPGSFQGDVRVDGPRDRVYVVSTSGLTIVDGG